MPDPNAPRRIRSKQDKWWDDWVNPYTRGRERTYRSSDDQYGTRRIKESNDFFAGITWPDPYTYTPRNRFSFGTPASDQIRSRADNFHFNRGKRSEPSASSPYGFDTKGKTLEDYGWRGKKPNRDPNAYISPVTGGVVQTPKISSTPARLAAQGKLNALKMQLQHGRGPRRWGKVSVVRERVTGKKIPGRWGKLPRWNGMKLTKPGYMNWNGRMRKDTGYKK